MHRVAILLLACAVSIASAADRLVMADTRPGVRVGYWLMERPDATATLMLLPGGGGGIGMKNGVPTSENFLVRSRDHFTDARFNVAIVGRPSDRQELDGAFRSSAEHVQDLRMIAAKLREELGKPVWLVGTSRGTISAAATAIGLDRPSIAGIVLTASVTNGKYAAPVPGLALSGIRVPVLVMHHRNDACRSCNPREAGLIVDRLTAAPLKKLLLVEGGSGARGDPCEALHWHGFIGMEREAVDAIADWIRNPAPERP